MQITIPKKNGGPVLTCEVSVVESAYLVDFGGQVHPRLHVVNGQGACTCAQGLICSAVVAVQSYLANGGPRALPLLHRCPICGAQTYRDRVWDGKYTKERGWRCVVGGLAHFLEAKAHRIQRNQARLRWLVVKYNQRRRLIHKRRPA